MTTDQSIRKDERIEVRDKRDQPFYIIDNALLRNHGKWIKPFGIAVYNALAMFAGMEQEAWPSHETIAELIGASKRKVIDTIAILIAEGLVKKYPRSNMDGGDSSNLYILCKQSEWTPGMSAQMQTGVQEVHGGGAGHAPGGVQEVHGGGAGHAPKQESFNKNQLEEEGALRAGAAPPPATAAPKESKAKAEKPVKDEHPAVALYRSLCAKQINDVQIALLEQVDPPLDILERAIREWKAAGHRPTNVSGVLDWVREPWRMERRPLGSIGKGKSIYADPSEIIPEDKAEREATEKWAREAYPERFRDEIPEKKE